MSLHLVPPQMGRVARDFKIPGPNMNLCKASIHAGKSHNPGQR
jgi:hypothetical protein